jgi:hypothetical protein
MLLTLGMDGVQRIYYYSVIMDTEVSNWILHGPSC